MFRDYQIISSLSFLCGSLESNGRTVEHKRSDNTADYLLITSADVRASVTSGSDKRQQSGKQFQPTLLPSFNLIVAIFSPTAVLTRVRLIAAPAER